MTLWHEYGAICTLIRNTKNYFLSSVYLETIENQGKESES